jgi:phage shock protein C
MAHIVQQKSFAVSGALPVKSAYEKEAAAMREQTRRLHRSSTNRMLAGVCGGLGEYLDIDPMLLRIVTLALILPFHIFVVLAYFALVLLLPTDNQL